MIELYCTGTGQCHYVKPETQMAGPSMGAHICNYAHSCEKQMDAKELFYHRLNHMGDLTYGQLCALKQESIHRQGFAGLNEIEKALIPHMKRLGYI